MYVFLPTNGNYIILLWIHQMGKLDLKFMKHHFIAISYSCCVTRSNLPDLHLESVKGKMRSRRRELDLAAVLGSAQNGQAVTDMDSVQSSSERSNDQRRASKRTEGVGTDSPLPELQRQGSEWTFQTVTLEWAIRETGSTLLPPGTMAAVKLNGGQQRMGLLTSQGSTLFDFNRSVEVICYSFKSLSDYFIRSSYNSANRSEDFQLTQV